MPKLIAELPEKVVAGPSAFGSWASKSRPYWKRISLSQLCDSTVFSEATMKSVLTTSLAIALSSTVTTARVSWPFGESQRCMLYCTVRLFFELSA